MAAKPKKAGTARNGSGLFRTQRNKGWPPGKDRHLSKLKGLPMSELIKTQDAAEILGLHVKTVRKLMASGKLEAVIVGSKYRTKREWVEAYLKPVTGNGVGNGRQKIRPEGYEASVRSLEAEFGLTVPGPRLQPST